ncbi:hypothetical protein TD95_001443 [Thielaviopsis punctulata]|uniref:Palmitoyltransferase n=1 Tax=Thielaviopsis punctulata TaxID=72032 RepID=A0A0F4ZAM3_9PEZI|nr:hypothetical protein TD95_001443 [Thielaviopsis punctulata]
MAPSDSASQPPAADHSHPQHAPDLTQVPRLPPVGPPSIISSRMTDIASEDGEFDADHENASQAASHAHSHSQTYSQMRSVAGTPTNKRRSFLASEIASRPGTALTGTSGRAWSGAQPLRVHHLTSTAGAAHGPMQHRGSIGGGSTITAHTTLSRSGSRSQNTRTHVPSVANQAFFHPMSSQKLQAQRAGAAGRRASETPSMHSVGTSATSVAAANFSAGLARIGNTAGAEVHEAQPPPSRGTEWTEQETLDRLTATTSPTGHRHQGSMSESLKPLQRRRDRDTELSVDTSRQYATSKTTQAVRAQILSPAKTPRSFRSSLFIPTGGGGGGGAGQNRDTTGAEKLSSAAPSESHIDEDDKDDDEGKRHPQPVKSLDHARRRRVRRMRRRQRQQQQKEAGKVYEYFDGNTVFCLRGRLQNTHAKPINIATGVLVALPMGLFLGFSAPWLWSNVSPAIPLTFAYVAYLCLSSFLRASTSDPGILPRNLHPFPPNESDDPNRPQPPTNDWVLVKSAEAATAAMEVPVKHCRTCNIWRPPRAHHCRLCDNCIEGHDHHCVWLNNCVGRRNYRFFFTFVSSAALLSLYMVGACLAHLLLYRSRNHVSFGHAINKFPVSFAMVIYGFLAALYPLALMGYHIFLMARGETTREYINSHKFPKSERYRAFTQGSAWRNWMAVLCRPRPPTFYQFKKYYVPGDQRLSAHRKNHRKRDSVELQNVRPVDAQAGPGTGAGVGAMHTPTGFQGPAALRAEQEQKT